MNQSQFGPLVPGAKYLECILTERFKWSVTMTLHSMFPPVLPYSFSVGGVGPRADGGGGEGAGERVDGAAGLGADCSLCRKCDGGAATPKLA